MPKLKTHSGAKKRFNLTKSGKVKRARAYKSHMRKTAYAPVAQLDRVSDSDSEGRWFESSRAYQKPP